MMRHSRTISKTLFALLLASLFVAGGCIRRPLEDPDFSTRIQVKVNISAIANVTCDVYNEKIPVPEINPEVMRVMFYDMTRDKMLAESFITDVSRDENGQLSVRGDIAILPGDYRLIIYQFGTESTLVNSYDSFENSSAYTDALSQEELKALSLKSDNAYDNQPIRYQPDHILVARSEHESIPYHAGVYTITADASSLVETYYLQVKVDGLQWVSSAKAVLTSMVPSVTLAEKKRDEVNPCAIYTPLLKSEDNGDPVVCNVFNTFGRIPESTNRLDVTFELRTTDGRTISKTFDISDLFLSKECIEHHWLLIEETIVVPEPEDPNPGGGGGFDPTVGDWEDEHHEIIM